MEYFKYGNTYKMIVAQVVVAHLVSRSLRAFGVESRVPFFTLHQM